MPKPETLQSNSKKIKKPRLINILDLGCGTTKVKNAIGVDKFLLPGVDVVADLDNHPYPFADNSFDEIHLNDIIEHLPDTIKTMEEIYRIAKPNAKIFIRTINWNSHYNAMDPTHIRTFHERTFDFFGSYPGRDYYSTARFEVISVKLGYNALARKLFRNEKLMKFLSHYFNNVLETLYFELKTIKKGQKNILKVKKLTGVIRCPLCLANGKSGKMKRGTNYLSCGYHHKYKIKNSALIIKTS